MGHQEQAWCRCRDPELLARPPRCGAGAPVAVPPHAVDAFPGGDAAAVRATAEAVGRGTDEAANAGGAADPKAGKNEEVS